MPASAKMTLYKGVDNLFYLQAKDYGTAAPIDLTGSSLELVIKTAVGGTTLVTINTADGGIVLTDAASGLALCNVSASDLSGVAAGTGYHSYATRTLSGQTTPLYVDGVCDIKELG